MKRKRMLILSLAAMMVLTVVGGAFAAVLYMAQFENTLGIKAMGDIKIWDSEAMTSELTSLSWGSELLANETIVREMWIENEGNLKVYCTWDGTGFSVSGGVYYIGDPNIASPTCIGIIDMNVTTGVWNGGGSATPKLEIAKAGVEKVTMTFTVGYNPPPGSYPFTLKVTSHDA